MSNKFNLLQRYKHQQEQAEPYMQQQHFKVFATLREAWHLTKGARKTLIAAFFISLLINIAIGSMSEAIFSKTSYGWQSVLLRLIQLGVEIIVSYPLIIGSTMLGIKLARGDTITLKQLFAYFQTPIFWQITKWLSWLVGIAISIGLGYLAILLCTNMNAIVSIVNAYLATGSVDPRILPKGISMGFILYIITLVYLWFSYQFSLPLIADQRLQASFALTLSRKGFNRNFLAIIGLNLIIFLLISSSLLMAYLLPQSIRLAAMGIDILVLAFIVMPWVSVAHGLVYHRIFKTPDIRVC